MTFRPPADDGASAITSYRIIASPGGHAATVAGSKTTATVNGLTGGKSYRFTVTATNAFGTGSASAASNAVKPLSVCKVPKLSGLTLSKARHALSKAHCAAGHVSRPRHSHGKLVVRRQSPKPGTVRNVGSEVSLTLGTAPKHHRARC